MPSVGWVCARSPFLGGEWLRATRPAALVGKRLGWHTAVARKMAVEQGEEGIVLLHDNGERFRPDVVVLRPLASYPEDGEAQDVSAYIQSAHAAGQKVIADLDDDIWSHEDRPDRGGKGWEKDDHYEEWLPLCDAYLASTKALQRIMGSHGLHPVYHLPNCYDVVGITHYGPAPGPGRRIGTRMWMHGRQQSDLLMYDTLVQPLLERHDLTFVHLGAGEAQMSFRARGWAPERLEEHPSMPAPLMGEVLGTMSIGVICLGDADYNAAKTLTHPVELASLGLPLVVASETDFYRGVPGVVEPTIEAMEERIVALLDPDYWKRASEVSTRWALQTGAAAEGDYLWGFRQIVQRLAN